MRELWAYIVKEMSPIAYWDMKIIGVGSQLDDLNQKTFLTGFKEGNYFII